MEIKIFGKKNCSMCEATKKKVSFLIEQLNMSNTVDVAYFDMDTVDGLAEGAMLDAIDTPTTIIFRDGSEVARWAERVPESDELKSSLII